MSAAALPVPATAPAVAHGPNLTVAVAAYGRYLHGSVIPPAVVHGYGANPQALVDGGTLQWTHAPVNCPILAAEAEPLPDATAGLIAERNELHGRVERAERSEKLLAAQVAALEGTIRDRDRAINRLVIDAGRLEREAKEAREMLDAMTAPTAPATDSRAAA